MTEIPMQTKPQKATKRPKTAVQKMYTDEVVIDILKAKNRAGMSIREIAKEYPGVTYGDIGRALKGHLPPSPHKRAALGLQPLIPAPACPKCGQVHVSRKCTAGKRTTKPRPRVWQRVSLELIKVIISLNYHEMEY